MAALAIVVLGFLVIMATIIPEEIWDALVDRIRNSPTLRDVARKEEPLHFEKPKKREQDG